MILLQFWAPSDSSKNISIILLPEASFCPFPNPFLCVRKTLLGYSYLMSFFWTPNCEGMTIFYGHLTKERKSDADVFESSSRPLQIQLHFYFFQRNVCVTVWPDLAKFRHFGNILGIFVTWSGGLFSVWQIWNLLWQNIYVFGQPFNVGCTWPNIEK